ncbi:hypothetical protein GGF43_003276 [Coemansia sp. RSA 2618]|nr:hypothetical protein GGF43_003276 [Coemansia sp. RSA 2618]
MFGFLRSALSPKFLRPLTAQPAATAAEAVRGMKVRSSVKLMDRAELVDGQFVLVIDTQLLGVQQYHVGQTYQLIGEIISVSKDEAPEDLFDDARYSMEIALQARVGKSVDGLDMAVYRESVRAMRRLLDI